MKIAYEKMNTVLEINTNCVNSLIVEKPGFLHQILMELKQAMEGEESHMVVSEQEKPVIASKVVSVVTDFVGFTLNQKSLLTKIISELDKTSKNELYFKESQEILAHIENYIMNLTLYFPCELTCERLNTQNLLKSVGISIVDDYETLEEQLLTYMDLAREFEGKKLFIFVNLRCLVEPERLQLMMDTALAREHQILLIDNVEYPKLVKERRIIIDADFCEI